MEKPVKKRPNFLSGCALVVLSFLCLAALLLMLCGLLAWVTTEDVDAGGKAGFFVGLIGLAIFGCFGFIVAYVQWKMEEPLKERYKAMGCFGLTALIGMCLAAAFVMLCGVIVWVMSEDESVAGEVFFFVGLFSLALFVGVGFVMPIVQWKKDKNAPPTVEPLVSWEYNEEDDGADDDADDDTDFSEMYPPSLENSDTQDRREKLMTTILIAGAAVLLAISLWWCMKGVSAVEEYRRVYDRPLRVSGVIYEHDSYSDDGDTDYRSYVGYTVNGQTYVGVYENVDKLSDLTPLNTVVTVEVSPEHPYKLLSELQSDSQLIILVFLMALLLSSWLFATGMKQVRRGDATTFADDEVLCKNLTLTLFGRFRIVFCLLAAIVSGLLVWRYPMLYDEKVLIFTAASAALWVVFFGSALRDIVCVRRGEYEVRTDVLVNKEIISGEGSDMYRLIYRSGDEENTWKTNVSRKRYNREKIGNTVKAVYIKGKKKPTLHYDGHGEVG